MSRMVALSASAALTVGLFVSPAAYAADTAPIPLPTGLPVKGTPPPLTATAQAILDARAKAKSTNQPVTVDPMTTQTSKTLANPDGSLSTTDSSFPDRVKQGSGWADVDPTLAANSDGTLSPRGAPTQLKLSGGGSGPLAVLTTDDGKQLAVNAPFPLPSPAVSGDTATYRGVLTPDVDLKVTALAQGGWRDVIVVKTAAAAANPALASLHFPITTTGLSPSGDAAGNLAFADGSGQIRMHAPTPLQWDSTLPAPAAPGATTTTGGTASPFAAPNAPSTSPGTSTAETPGQSANVAPISTHISATALDLTIGQGILGKGTGPWYIDPSISTTSGPQGSVQVQENHPDTQNFNALSDLGTGYCDYSDCTGNGRYRAYFHIAVNPAIYTQPNGAPQPPTVYGSTLYTQSTGSSSPSTSTPMGVYSVGYAAGMIGQGTTWNNQPCGSGMSGCSKVSGQWMSGTGPVNFDVTSAMQQVAANHAPDWTIALVPDNEYNDLYRQHFANNPHVTTNYDITPSIWYPRTSPSPGFASSNTRYDCTTGGAHPWDNVAWVGANQNISLTASSWSPAGLNLHTVFRIWDDNNSSWSQTPDSGWAGSWNPNGVSVPVGSLTDGHQYGWTANAYDYYAPDTGLVSPSTPWCYFRVDKTLPTVGVSSTDWPPSGTPNSTPTHFAGDTTGGTFNLTGTDPAPAVGSASGVACFRWTADPTQASVTGWHCTDGSSAGVVMATPVSGTNTATGSFTYAPGINNWGTNVIYVQAQDNAGNFSQPVAYTFYAPWNKNYAPRFGNVTGNGKPDILLTDTVGNLRMIDGTVDPVSALSAKAISAPNAQDPTYAGTTWKDYQITHRGGLKANATVDDVIVHNRVAGSGLAKSLYLATNDNAGGFNGSSTAIAKPQVCEDTTNTAAVCSSLSNGADWSTVTQILALGTPTGEAVDSTQTHMTSQTSLLAVENGNLWLYTPNTDGSLHDGRKLSNQGGWDQYDLIGPGPASGVTNGTLKVPTLWARNRTDGTIHAYPIKYSNNAPDFSSFAGPSTGTIAGFVGVDPSTYPTIGSSGDLNGDGIPDLWALDNVGHLQVWAGTADSSGNVTGFNGPASLGDLRTPTGRWQLNGTDPATTVKGGVSYAADKVDGTNSTTVAALDNTKNGEIDTTTPIDLTKSFTISVWAKASATGGIVASQDGTNTSGFILWPDTPSNTWRFAMASADDNSWPYQQTDTTNAAAVVQTGVWTKLTASYNATTAQTALYVNGVLAGTGTHTPSLSTFTKPLLLGRYQSQGQPSSYFNGSLSNLTVYNTATTPTTSASGPIVSGVSANSCVDNQNASVTTANPVDVYTCNKSAAQAWSFNTNGTLIVQGGCLEAANGGTTNNTLVRRSTCTGSNAQQWLPRADGSMYNPTSGRCLDDPNANTANGTQLELFDCNRSPAQNWTIAPNS